MRQRAGAVSAQQRRGDALRGLAAVVAREHAVHVGAVEGPVARAHVHAEHVHGGDDEHAAAQLRAGASAGRDAAQEGGEAREHEHAVQLVAVQARHERDARRLGRRADVVVGDVEVLARGRRHVQQRGRRHRLTSMMRASSEPS